MNALTEPDKNNVQESYLSNSGAYYRYNNIKPGRQTLVFVHGLTGSSSAWWPYEKILGDDYNLVSYDLLGHGKSPKPRDFAAYNIKSLADDIYNLTRQLKINNFVLISHSFGTLVAVEFLLAHEHMVKKAVFLSPNAGVDKTVAARISRRPISALANIFTRWPCKKSSGGHIDYSYYPNVGDWDMALNLADMKNTSLGVYFNYLKQIYNSDYNNSWQKLHLKNLVVHGQCDSVIPLKHVKAMQQNMQNSRLLVLENSNHLFVLNNPAGTAKIINDFIRES